MRQEYETQIKISFQKLRNDYGEIQTNYITSLNQMADNLNEKRYSLKLASINQRAMMLTLFDGYCQALFYNTFRDCNKNDVPSIGEETGILLEKLNLMRWEAITSLTQGKSIPVICICLQKDK